MPDDQLARLAAAVADRYRIDRALGRGGMATVYLAEDLRHGRRVAIKVLLPELGGLLGPRRFLKEIEIAASLTHPNILPVHDSGEADGLLYYVMPYVEGESLRQRLERERQLPLDEALEIVREVGDALSYAHSVGVIHRDVKPENILLQAGHALIADFGLARAFGAADRRITQTGLVVGTPAYMSPEQAAGSSELDGRTDIYALACVLYEMLGGEPPHTGATPQAILARQISGEVRSLRPLRASVSAQLDAAIRHALAPTPADRFRTVPEFLEAIASSEGGPAVARTRPRPAPWTVLAAAAGIVLIAAVAGYLRIVGVGPPAAVAGQGGLAVFPFRPASPEAELWSEQLPDLLATVLDGTPGVRVADPWSLWRSLRPSRDARARSPTDPSEAATLAVGAGATRFVLGSVATERDDVRIQVRLYRAGGSDPLQALLFEGPADSITGMVQRLAVAVITALAPDADTVSVAPVSRYGTRSAEALKAYLQAREAARRGRDQEADDAIDRALRLDSGFALALIEAVTIKSSLQFSRGEFFSGLMPLAERAVTLGDSLPERDRLRAEATLASLRTEGLNAATAVQRILQRDSTDLGAWLALSYYHLEYGWQYGAHESDALRATERAVQLDSTHVPSLLRRAWLAVTLEDADAVRRQLHRLAAADTANPVVRTAIGALRAVLATDAEYDATLDSLTSAPFPDWLTLYRFLRLQSPRRAELLLHRLRRTASPGSPAEGAYLGEWARMLLAEGRLAEVDSGIVAGAYNAGELYKHLNRFLVAASLAGVGDERATRRALAWLEAYVPPDSASAYFETRPVWWTGWLIGAYHASLGDTAVARRWQRVIGTFPAGGTPQDYRAGLRADIEARLAVRRGAMDRAVEEAQRAVQQWSIHTGNDWEALAAPAMRFHLAMALRATGHPDSAAALLRSLVPPTTWMGFLTARASYELGRLSEESGDLDAAARHYATALNLWERGDAAVAEWRDLAREGLRRVMAVRG